MPEEVELQSEEAIEEQPKANFFDKIKLHKFKILAEVLGVFVFVGAVFGAYKFLQLRQARTERLCGPCPMFDVPPNFCQDGILAPGKIDNCGCQWPPTCQSPTANWKTYSGYGVELKYPQDWKVEEQKFDDKPQVWVYPEIGQIPDTIPSHLVTYTVISNTTAKTPQEVWLSEKRAKHFSMAAKNILREGQIEVNDQVGYQAILKIPAPKPTERPFLMRKMTFLLHESTAVIIDYGEWVTEEEFKREELWPKYGDTLNLMLSTFRFTSEESSGERVFCEEPRPEVCTMECIVNPPYICGSDGKPYCSECQACANPKVEWYVIQDAPCGP